MFGFGIIAGWTNENTSVAMIIMIMIYLLCYRMRNIKICLWNISGLLGSIIGCLLMLLAPGTSTRLNGAGGSGSLFTWLKRFVFYTTDAVIYLNLLTILIVIIITLYFAGRNIKKHTFINDIKENIVNYIKKYDIYVIYFVGFLASLYSMIASPQFPKRSWSGPIILLIIFTMRLFSLLNNNSQIIRITKNIILAIFICLSFSNYFNAYFELKNITIDYNHRIELIENAKLKNKNKVEIPTIKGTTNYSCYDSNGDLNSSENEWPNTAIARYYGVKKIIKSR